MTRTPGNFLFCFALAAQFFPSIADFTDQRRSFIRRHEQGDQALEINNRAVLLDTHPVSAQQKAPAGQRKSKIPMQVILTGPFNSFAEVRNHRSDLSSLGITPDMHVRYFNNSACRAYLEATNPDLVLFFNAETHGSLRGDICRTAVLAREGGFYVDLDMQLVVPLKELVDDETTFMSARSSMSGVLNAIIAATPHNPVMLSTLAHIGKWYRKETPHDGSGLLGPETMRRGLDDSMRTHCPDHTWANAFLQFRCGSGNAFRFFTEQLMNAGNCEGWGAVMCPKSRADSQFQGSRYALFDGRKDGMEAINSPTAADVASRQKRFIGWSRYNGCEDAGCGLTGGLPN